MPSAGLSLPHEPRPASRLLRSGQLRPSAPSLLALSHVICSVVASALGCGFSQRTFADPSSRTGVRRVPGGYLLVLHALEWGPAGVRPSRLAGLTSAIPTAVHRRPRRQTHVSTLSASPPSLAPCPRHGTPSVFGVDGSRDVERRKTCICTAFPRLRETPRVEVFTEEQVMAFSSVEIKAHPDPTCPRNTAQTSDPATSTGGRPLLRGLWGEELQDRGKVA